MIVLIDLKDDAQQTEVEPDTWVSLQEASALLGVATSTVRRWADAGRMPMKRTLGGHRRFLRAALQQLAQALPQDAAVAPPLDVDEQALESRAWHTRLADRSASHRMRELGQRLLGVLLQYINRPDDAERFLAEARNLGTNYGVEARAAKISMYDTIEAFLLFRNMHAQYVVPMPQVTQPAEWTEWLELHTRVDRFMDTLLLGVVAGYENEREV